LRGVLADQLELAQHRRDVVAGSGQACEQLFGAFEAQAIEGDFQVFRRLGQAAMGVVVGFAHHAQHQGRAVLHQFGDIAQRAAAVADGPDPVVALRHRQAHISSSLTQASSVAVLGRSFQLAF
jgi:hypothetical protein